MEKVAKTHNRNSFILGILFILFLGIYLLLKAINEISQNSIEYIGNLNEILFVVVISGVGYYLYSVFIAKDSKFDILRVNETLSKVHPFIRFLINVTAGFLGVVAISYIVFYKTLYWNGGEFIVLFAAILCFLVIMASLSMDS